jgi:membrane associated rhomboid family serine protease
VTPWVLRLIILNGLVFLLEQAAPSLVVGWALQPALALFRPWTFLTYMFLHANLSHIFFNMLGLFFFGPVVESRLGSAHFLKLYLASGVVGGLCWMLFTALPMGGLGILVGASGAVFGVQLAFAYFWPRQQIFIWGVFPIEARWLVLIMTVMSLYFGFAGSGGGVAHLAHLGGFAGGYLYIKWMERRQQAPLREWRHQGKAPAPRRERTGQTVERWSRIKRDDLHEVNRAELDRILDKIGASGIASLTASEREFLDRFSARSQ